MKVKKTLDISSLKMKVERNLTKNIDEEMQSLYRDMVEATPVDTGKMKASWKLDNWTISNDVPYASYIWNGSSSQLPNGYNSIISAHLIKLRSN